MSDANGNGGALIYGFTKQQILQALGLALGIVGTVATSTGWLTAQEASQMTQTVTNVATGLLSLGGFILTIWQSRKAASVAAASQVPGVQVHVNVAADTPAPPAVVDMARSADPADKDVVPMGPSPGDPQEVQKPATGD